MTKLPAFWNYSLATQQYDLASRRTCNSCQVLELIADTRCYLIVAQLLLEADKAKIQDRYRIYKGLGFILRVAVFEPCEPVVREGVVETCSDRPTHARAIATD